jgi:hypothetical protein
VTRAGYTVGVFVLLSPAQCRLLHTLGSLQYSVGGAGGFHLSFVNRKTCNSSCNLTTCMHVYFPTQNAPSRLMVYRLVLTHSYLYNISSRVGSLTLCDRIICDTCNLCRVARRVVRSTAAPRGVTTQPPGPSPWASSCPSRRPRRWSCSSGARSRRATRT